MTTMRVISLGGSGGNETRETNPASNNGIGNIHFLVKMVVETCLLYYSLFIFVSLKYVVLKPTDTIPPHTANTS